MITVNLDDTYEAKLRELLRSKPLADSVSSCRQRIAENISHAQQKNGSQSIENFLDEFLGSYAALDDGLMKREVFDGSDASLLTAAYSLGRVSGAITRKLEDEAVQEMRAHEVTRPFSPITYSDFKVSSPYALIERVVQRLQEVPGEQSMTALRYWYATFFERLRDFCGGYMQSKGFEGPAEEITIMKAGLDFTEVRKGGSPEKKMSHATLESVPTELPQYSPSTCASLEKVVGNIDAKTVLHAALIRLLKYDTKTQSNPFCPFRDAFIVYGEPGVGKNFTVDALLNHVRETAGRFGERVEFVNLAHGLRSIYKDRSAQVLEAYVGIQNKGDGVYVNIVDEADGIFTMNERGEMDEESKKLLREMKCAINNGCKGNTVTIFMTNYAEKFEAALKQRFTTLQMEGPSSPEDFGVLFAQELGSRCGQLTAEQFSSLGTQIYAYKQRFSGIIPITGRDVKTIVSPFVSGDDLGIVAHEGTILSASSQELAKLMLQLQAPLSYDDMSSRLDSHIDRLVQAARKTTARYNGAMQYG